MLVQSSPRRGSPPSKEERAQQKQQSKERRAHIKREAAADMGLAPRPPGRSPKGATWNAQQGAWMSDDSGEAIQVAAVEVGDTGSAGRAASLSTLASDAKQLEPPRYKAYRAAGNEVWRAKQDEWLAQLRDLVERRESGRHNFPRAKDWATMVELVPPLPEGNAERTLAWKNALKVHAGLCSASDAKRKAREVARKTTERAAKRQRQHEEQREQTPAEAVSAVEQAWERKPMLSLRDARSKFKQDKGSETPIDGSAVVAAMQIVRRDRHEAGKPSATAIRKYAKLMKWDANLSQPSIV